MGKYAYTVTIIDKQQWDKNSIKRDSKTYSTQAVHAQGLAS